MHIGVKTIVYGAYSLSYFSSSKMASFLYCMSVGVILTLLSVCLSVCLSSLSVATCVCVCLCVCVRACLCAYVRTLTLRFTCSEYPRWLVPFTRGADGPRRPHGSK